MSGRTRVLVIGAYWLVGAGCGRLGFGGAANGDATGSDDVSGDGPPAVSCSGLAPTCGQLGTSPCCGSPLVPGGTFHRSYDFGTDNAYTDAANPATISDFRLDTYEVTVERFRQFVNAGMGTQQNPPAMGAGARTLNGMAAQGGWDGTSTAGLVADTATLRAAVKCDAIHQSWTDAPGANEILPMTCITWYEAMAFCTWDGGFLPTEAEWNYAAAGGSEQRAFPWSSPPSSVAIDCSYANYDPGTGYCGNVPNGAVNRVGADSPKGDGKWGQADLGGNVYEWTLDWYANSYSTPCNDCADLTIGSGRVLHGGGFRNVELLVRGAFRFNNLPTFRFSEIGVRCARTP